MIDSIPSRPIATRPPSEQPTLWILLLAGSVLLHGVLFLLLRPLWVEQVSGQGGDGTIAIDLVDTQTGQTSPPPQASTKAGPIAPPVPIVPPPTSDDRAIQAPARSPQPTPKSIVPAVRRPLPSGTAAPDAQPNPTASVPTQAGPSPEPPRRAISPSPLPVPKPSTPAPKPSTPAPKLSTPPTRGPISSGIPLPPPRSTSQEIGPVPPSQPAGTAPIPTNVPSGSGERAGLQMTIVSLREINQRDITDEKAELRSPGILQFPQAAIPPCVRHNMGQTVTLRMVVDRTGKPKQESFSKGVTCEAIVKLVRENVQFRPARQAGGQIDSQVKIDLRFDPL